MYYDTASKKCTLRTAIKPVVEFLHNPCIIKITLPSYSTNIFNFLIQDINQFTISISNFNSLDFTYVMEYDKPDTLADK